MPPLAVIVWLYATPTVPVGSVAVEVDSVISEGAVIWSMAVALVACCESGLVTVIVRAVCAAPEAIVTFKVMCVESVYVTLLTITPTPLTAAEMRFGKADPGS